jgi:flagellar biosynthesis/type III secretory pathway chaperone
MGTKTGEFIQQLQDGVYEVDGLLTALKAEYQALEKNDLVKFEQAVVNKQQHSSNLQQLETALTLQLTTAGFKVNSEGVEQFLRSTTPAAEIESGVELWHRLQACFESCRTQNLVNGHIINLASYTVQQALRVLTGKDTSNTSTYNAGGKSKEDGKGNSIAIA